MTSHKRRRRSRSPCGLPAESNTERGRKVERQLGGKQPRRVLIGVVSLTVALGAYFGYRYYAAGPPESDRQAETAVVGLTERESHENMVTALGQIAANTGSHPYLGGDRARQLRQLLQKSDRRTSDRDLCQMNAEAGVAEVNLGNLRAGIGYLTRAYELIPAAKLEIALANYVRFKLGVAWLRLGETENCCVSGGPESCIVPIQPGGVHTKTEGSTKAIGYFKEVLSTPSDSRAARADAGAGSFRVDLAARWLLNVAYMTLGGYPDQVPKEFLVPTAAFESEISFPRFANVAEKLNLNTFNLCGGAIIDDFDNDGYLDIVTSTWDPRGQLRLFRNNADGTFSDRTEAAGLLGLFGGLNILQTDYDNDGHLDILVLRGAWLGVEGRHPNSLLHNNGDGTFSDVTIMAGLAEVHYPTQTADWADYDNDGDLDLYIGNEHMKGLTAPCQLFRNNGDGTFTDVAADAMVQNFGVAKGVSFGDFNGDRFVDLYVSNYGMPNRLYQNNGDGTFTEVAASLNVTSPNLSFATWFWDFDNDGELDLFVASYTGHVDDLVGHYLGQTPDYEPSCLYRGNGRGGFERVTREQGLEYPILAMGSNFGDLNNDGYLDFYIGTGNPDYENLMPNLMFLNRGGDGFVDVTMAGGFGHLQKGHGIAFGDLDNDGDADVFAQMGGAYAGDKFSDALFENPGFANHWITVKLVGVTSNRAAIGARIRAEIVENGKTRSIFRHVNSGGSFGANPLRQTIGLGGARQIEVLEVYWPTTGTTQTFRDVSVDQCIRIVEGEERFTPIRLKTLKLGG